jgi:hypothetical protein
MGNAHRRTVGHGGIGREVSKGAKVDVFVDERSNSSPRQVTVYLEYAELTNVGAVGSPANGLAIF